jgi:hypothetical protein
MRGARHPKIQTRPRPFLAFDALPSRSVDSYVDTPSARFSRTLDAEPRMEIQPRAATPPERRPGSLVSLISQWQPLK